MGKIPRRAPHFVTRVQLDDLRETLRECQVAVVVTGMRGAGKTQVAAAYTQEAIASGEVNLVGWVNAETADTLYSGLDKVAARVGVADPQGDSAESARRLRDHLSARTEPALLILDNATDPDLVDSLLPVGNMTRVIVTSTDRAFTQFGEMVDAGTGYARAESVRYLGDATRLNDPDGAATVAEDLGDLPLALSAAAATITGRRLDYSRYRRLLTGKTLHSALPRRPGSDHPLAVDQALLLAVQTIETPTGEPELDEAVQRLLGTVAMLAPDGVDYAILLDTGDKLDEALQRCVDGSLLSWSTEDSVVMHRLVARVVRERACVESNLDELALDALDLMASWVFNESEAFQRREEGSRLVDHIEAVWDAIADEPDFDPEVLELALGTRRWATRQLIAAADRARSITLAQQTLADSERVLNTDHPDTLIARNNLAGAHQSAGQITEAINLHQENLTEREHILGNDHPDTLTTRNNLAYAYKTAGHIAEAIALYEHNLTEKERIFGADHPATLTCRNNLAAAYKDAGRITEAINLFEHNLTKREHILGNDHPDTLTSRNNLASAHQSAGHITEAINLFEHNLTKREHILGNDHPDTLMSRNNLASAYKDAGQIIEAIDLHQRNLLERERTLGNDHPDTLTSRNNLASAYQSAGRITEAINLCEHNLIECERTLGNDHPDTLMSRNNLASVYKDAGRITEAIDLFERSLEEFEQVLGDDHPGTFTARNNLAEAYRTAGRITKAIDLHQRNLAEREYILGDDHPDTRASRYNLASTYL